MAKHDRSRRKRAEKVGIDLLPSNDLHFEFLLPPASPDSETDDSDTSDIEDDSQEASSSMEPKDQTIPIEKAGQAQHSNATRAEERFHCSNLASNADREATSNAIDISGASPAEVLQRAIDQALKRLGPPPTHPDSIDKNKMYDLWHAALQRYNDYVYDKAVAIDHVHDMHQASMRSLAEARNKGNEDAENFASTSGLNKGSTKTNETATGKQSHCSDASNDVDREDPHNIDTVSTACELPLQEEIDIAIRRLGPPPPHPDTFGPTSSYTKRLFIVTRYNDYIFDKILTAVRVRTRRDERRRREEERAQRNLAFRELLIVEDSESSDSVQVIEQPIPLVIIESDTSETDNETCNQNDAQDLNQSVDSQDSTLESSMSESIPFTRDLLSPPSLPSDEESEDEPHVPNEMQEMDSDRNENTNEWSQDSNVMSIPDSQRQISSPKNKELPNIASFAMLQSVSRKRLAEENSQISDTETLTINPRPSTSRGERLLPSCNAPKRMMSRESPTTTTDEILEIAAEVAVNATFKNPKASTSRLDQQLSSNLASSAALKPKVSRAHHSGTTNDIFRMVEAAIHASFKKIDVKQARNVNQRGQFAHLKRRSLRKRTDIKKGKFGSFPQSTSSYPNSSSSSSSETFSD